MMNQASYAEAPVAIRKMASQLGVWAAVLTTICTVVFSVIASTLAGLIPAWRAARLKPVEALRSE